MAPDRTILHLVEKKIQVGGRPRPTPVQNYGVHTIKPQLRVNYGFDARKW